MADVRKWPARGHGRGGPGPPKRSALLWSLLSLGLIALFVWGLVSRSDRMSEPPKAGSPELAVQREDGAADPGLEAPSEESRLAVEPEIVDVPEDDAAGTLEILVVESRTRRPLEGANLHAYGPGVELEVLATSDPDGLVTIDRARVEGRDVMCRLEGYAEERVASPASVLPARVVVELVRALELKGRIVVPRGDTVPHGLFVLAWPESEAHPGQRTLTELLTHPYCRHTESGERGEFTFQGRSDTTYMVTAGGMGWVAEGIKTGRPGGQPVQVMVHRLYGVELRLQSGGAPLRLHPSFGGWHYGTPKLPEAHKQARGVSWGNAGAGLNVALQRAIEDARIDPWSRIPLFLNAFHEGVPTPSTLEGLSMEIQFPGYRSTQVVLDCPRIDLGMETVTVELERSGTGFGSLTLDVDPRLQAALLRESGSRLILHAEGAEREYYFLTGGAERSESSVTWTGVPAGVYRAAFAASHSPEDPVAVRPWAGGDEVVVTEGVTTRVVIARDDLGLIVMEPRLDGRPYAGHLSVRWRVAGDAFPVPQWWPRTFPGPPYSLGPVPPGTYDLEVHQPFHRREDPPGATIEMEPRGTVVVELPLERRKDG